MFLECTDNHPEGIKAAKATAAAMFLSRTGHTKNEIKGFVQNRFDYNLERTLAEVKPGYKFNETCQEIVPEAITCFLESAYFEDAIREALWPGGYIDTLACITGGIAEAFYQEIPDERKRKSVLILLAKFMLIADCF